MNPAAIKQLIAQCIVDAMIAYGANRASGNRAHNETSGSARGVEHTVRNCSYKEFLTYMPYNFKGTKGVVGLTRWFEKMESVFHVSNCAENCQVKFSARTLLDGALTWNEVQKMEIKLWNLSVKGTDIVDYTRRFQKLALLCPTMVTPEYKMIERYILVARAMAARNEKKSEEKSKEKRLEDVPIVRDFTEVFPEDLPGLLPEMDNPDITMKEYVQHETEKALRNNRVYNRETAKYDWLISVAAIAEAEAKVVLALK
ncbi:hypothetical protein Tco_1242749 [Tanacetum coccineum]